MIGKALFFAFTLMINSLASSAEELSEIPVTQLKITSQSIKLSKISDVLGRSITSAKTQLIINDGRNLWRMSVNAHVMKRINLNFLPEEANWFSTVCATTTSLFVAVSDYPEKQKIEELAKSRGDFVRGPSAKGFLTILPASIKYTNSPTITSRPPTDPQTTPENIFTYEIQSCSWHNSTMYFGSYGALGKVNLSTSTVDLIEEDEAQSLSRVPLIADKDGLWYAIDSGGLEGASLVNKPITGGTLYYSISNGEDIISYTSLVKHHGQLIIGTTHGLFILNQGTRKLKRINFGLPLQNEFISSLLSYNNYLWVFAGGGLLKVDLINSTAIFFSLPPQSNWFAGSPLNKSWILLSTDGIWKGELKTSPN